MSVSNLNPYDILIAGSGFAGSLTALILHQLGFKICLIEKGKHPRFAIGESSTPLGDIMLRNLSAKYNLPWLHSFSRYGSWQQTHPEIVCGIKRGFSFFKHTPGKEFTTDDYHHNELFVAASDSDILSDTNWLRADFDSFLVNKVIEAGIDYFDLSEIVSGKRENSLWEFEIINSNQSFKIYSSFFIDATGSSTLLHNLLGIESSSQDFLTNSFTLFSHFQHIPYWTDMMKEAGFSNADFPYNPDLSATHHIMDEGWLWALRFNDERTSMGFVLHHEEAYRQLSTDKIWNDLLSKYPTIDKIFQGTQLSPQPGKIIRSGRLQRKIANCFGPGWVALPHTAGFVDPLFSTGIAHSLSGIERIINILSKNWNNDVELHQSFGEYEREIFAELKLLDMLIAGCYKTMNQFELFNTWSMLYFAVTIHYESYRLRGETSGSYLHADQPSISDMVQKSYTDLLKTINRISKVKDISAIIQDFTGLIRDRIKPINTAGLLDAAVHNMYRHTAVTLTT